MVMGRAWKQAGFPFPGVYVHLYIYGKMSTESSEGEEGPFSNRNTSFISGT